MGGMMRSIVRLGVQALGLFVIPCSLGAYTQQFETPLQIVSTTVESNELAPPDRPTEIVKFVLKNQSNKTITAWRFSCVEVVEVDQVAIGSVGTDAFLGYERQKLRGTAPDPDGAIEPGGLREVEDDRVPGGVVEECGVPAVIFADTSYAGDPKVVERLFASRARMLTDVRVAIGIISSGLEGLEELDPEDVAQNIYADRIYNALDPRMVEHRRHVERVLDSLRSEETLITKHLPESRRPTTPSTLPADD